MSRSATVALTAHSLAAAETPTATSQPTYLNCSLLWSWSFRVVFDRQAHVHALPPED